MKDIVSYCDKTIARTKQNMRETKADMKSVTAKEEYFQIEEIIKTIEAKIKHLLHQHKVKKNNSLKNKPEKTREETLQPTKEPTAFKKLFTNAIASTYTEKL